MELERSSMSPCVSSVGGDPTSHTHTYTHTHMYTKHTHTHTSSTPGGYTIYTVHFNSREQGSHPIPLPKHSTVNTALLLQLLTHPRPNSGQSVIIQKISAICYPILRPISEMRNQWTRSVHTHHLHKTTRWDTDSTLHHQAGIQQVKETAHLYCSEQLIVIPTAKLIMQHGR